MRLLNTLFAATSLVLPLASAQSLNKTGDPITIGTGTYPRATKLADGTFLATYSVHDSTTGNTTLAIAKAPADASKWDQIGSVATRVTATSDLDNPYLHQLPSGDILCAYRNHDKVNGAYTYYRITVSISTNGGVDWAFLTDVNNHTISGTNGNWEPFLMDSLDKKTLQLYFSLEDAANDQDSILAYSTDEGKTWPTSTTISGTGVTARDGMLGVARVGGSDSKNLIAIFESGVGASPFQFSVHTITSDNDGAPGSWSTARGTVYAPAGANAGAPQILAVGGFLVASFATNEDVDDKTANEWPYGNIKLMVSGDGGATWEDKTTVSPLPSYWAGLLGYDDESFFVLYETGGVSKAQKIHVA